jgi:CheY-like chemotaxis protein
VQGCVLYVEDNPSNVLLVRESLGLRPGVELIVAGNVHEGLAAVARQRFDLVLLDLQLPDGDGYEVLQALRAQPQGQQTPCVAVTANAMINERNRALEAGFDEFWTKPLNLPAFLAGLDHWVDRKSSSVHRA